MDNIYEDVQTALCCVRMDIGTLTDGMELTAKQQEVMDRIKRNVQEGIEANAKLRLATRGIADALEVIYPTLYWERFGVVARQWKEEKSAS